jgi:hypothetical protein
VRRVEKRRRGREREIKKTIVLNLVISGQCCGAASF